MHLDFVINSENKLVVLLLFLGVPVPETVLKEKPLKYVSLPSHIQYSEAKRNTKNTEKVRIVNFHNCYL